MQRGARRVPAPPPALPGELVRSRLLDDVNRRFQVPLTVIVAGAGFGKSTLLAQAIRANQADPRGIDAWLSCEPADCDADHLASAVVSALGQDNLRGEPVERILDAVGHLAPIDVCVVIDDVHEVPPQSTAAALLTELVVRLPPHAHLVLAGRTAPPFPLPVRRAAGQLVEVGIDELAFTPTEVNALATSLGRDAAPGELGLGKFAGWPSLVRLALSAPEGSAPQFLWEEVVAGLSGPARCLLLALATLGWGTASDVAWVAGSGDGGSDPLVDARLDMIASNVPLVSGDADGWYRVHHLWEEAVERIFSIDDRVGMRQRALELFQRRRRDVANRLERGCGGVTPGCWGWPAESLSTKRRGHCRWTRQRAGWPVPRSRHGPPLTCVCSKSPSAMPATTTTLASTASSTRWSTATLPMAITPERLSP